LLIRSLASRAASIAGCPGSTDGSGRFRRTRTGRCASAAWVFIIHAPASTGMMAVVNAMPGQCHAGPVPCRASAMLGWCHAGLGRCHARLGQCHAMLGQCHARLMAVVNAGDDLLEDPPRLALGQLALRCTMAHHLVRVAACRTMLYCGCTAPAGAQCLRRPAPKTDPPPRCL
jgi:hypothetical protein